MSRGSFPAPVAIPSDRFWGKTAAGAWHPLIAHAADVAAVMARLLSDDSLLARRLATLAGSSDLDPTLRARLVLLAACHDLGKVNHGFQAKVRAAERHHHWPALGHVQPLIDSIAVVPELRELVMDIFARLGGPPALAGQLLACALAHHGRPHRLDQSDPKLATLWQPQAPRDPIAAARRLVDHAVRWAKLPDGSPPPPPATPAFFHLLAGLVQLADWIGSTQAAFPFAPWADDDPDDYFATHAAPRAADACARIGLVPRTRPVSLTGLPLLGRLFPALFDRHDRVPTPLQRHVAEMPLPQPGARLLIESETGSGKTEAALTLYARLRAAGLVSGLFFALPTRATAGAMLERVTAALATLYEGDERPSVALAAGGEQPRHLPPPALDLPPNRDDDPRDADLSHWASNHLSACFAAEIVIGTVDQALLAALPVKNAHLRLAALARHLLVVDELHSYDCFMTSLLRRLLSLVSQAGGITLFMSATLSHAAARTLGGGPQLGLDDALARPYPSLSVSPQPNAGWTDHPLPAAATPKRVAWRCLDEDAALGEAVAAARDGARVLFVRNTVKAARAAVTTLLQGGHADLLWRPDHSPHRPAYHARYVLPDRLALDDAVRRRFGPAAATTTGGCLLVSTQVAEQSLDVDFDLLVSDLCPVDVLLQRVGRAHRHRARDRYRPPAYQQPTPVLVVAPEGGFSDRLDARTVDVGWGETAPYDDYRVAELTWRLIRDRPEVTIPTDNRTLVEAVYHPDHRAALEAEPGWKAYAQRPELREANRCFVATATALPFDKRYADLDVVQRFDNELGIAYRTRLGDDTIRLELPEPVRCWYAEPDQPVLHAELPAWALPKDVQGQPVTAVQPRPACHGATCFAIQHVRFCYGPFGWDWQEEE